MDYKVYHWVAIAKFIGIPENELDKVVIEGSASPSIRGGIVGITVKVIGDNVVPTVAQDALKGALQSLLHHFLDVNVFGSFFPGAGQFHD